MDKKKGAAVLLVITACLGALGFFWPFGDKPPVLQLHGLVEIQEIRLSSKIGGRIKKVLTEEGALVQAGQPLVELEAPELEAQRAQMIARVQAAQAQLDKARGGARYEEKDLARAQVQAAQARLAKLKAGFREEEKEQCKASWRACKRS